jgi:putative oxidoreductase
MTTNTRAADLALFLLRCGMGLLLAVFNGWGMVAGAYANLFGGREWGFIGFVEKLGFPFPRFFAVCAALAEFAGGLLLAAGLFTRYAATVVAFNMNVVVYYHLTTDWRFEMAAHYWLVAVLFMFVAPGKLSIDGWLESRQWTCEFKANQATPGIDVGKTQK